MKILFVGNMDFASVAYSLSEALNRAGHEANVVTEIGQRFGLPNGHVVSQGFPKSEYVKLLNSADLIVSTSGYFDYRPFGLPFPKDAKLAIWNGGSNYRQNADVFEEHVLPLYDFCYAHWDLKNLSTRNNLLNAPIDTDRYRYITRRSFGDKGVRIGHIPSSDQKGTDIFISAMKELKEKYSFNADAVGPMSHSEVMREKRKYHVYFDQILNQPIPPRARKPYGLALVEAAAYGCVCICGCSTPDDWPIGKAFNKDMIKDLCIPFLEGDFELWEIISKQTRNWVVENHSYQACVNQFMKPLEGKV